MTEPEKAATAPPGRGGPEARGAYPNGSLAEPEKSTTVVVRLDARLDSVRRTAGQVGAAAHAVFAQHGLSRSSMRVTPLFACCSHDLGAEEAGIVLRRIPPDLRDRGAMASTSWSSTTPAGRSSPTCCATSRGGPSSR